MVIINSKKDIVKHFNLLDEQEGPASIYINPFMQNERFYLNSLDRSISSRRDDWLVFINTMFK